MSNGALTRDFFACGGIQAEGNVKTASAVSDVARTMTEAPKPSVNNGPGKPGL